MKPQTVFRTKPVVVSAMRYTEKSRANVVKWLGLKVIATGIDDDGALYERENLLIRTLEGDLMAKLGDWIVRSVAGEFYPVRNDIFEKTYERVRRANGTH